MNPANASRGQLIAGASAVLLLIFMFFSWFSVSGLSADVEGLGAQETTAEEDIDAFFEATGADSSLSAWDSGFLVWFLLLVATLGVLAIVVATVAGVLPRLPRPPGLILMGLGGLALAIVLLSLIFPPGLEVSSPLLEGVEVNTDMSREIGVFLGLLAAAGMTVGGFLANREGNVGGTARPSGTAPASPPSTASTPPAGTPPAGSPGPGTGAERTPPPPPAPERRSEGGPPAT